MQDGLGSVFHAAGSEIVAEKFLLFLSSLLQLLVSDQPETSDDQLLAITLVDQQPIRFQMTFPPLPHFSLQLMIANRRRECMAVHKEIQYPLQTLFRSAMPIIVLYISLKFFGEP